MHLAHSEGRGAPSSRSTPPSPHGADGNAHDSPVLRVFQANLGNMDRIAVENTLIANVCEGRWHLMLLQEGNSTYFANYVRSCGFGLAHQPAPIRDPIAESELEKSAFWREAARFAPSARQSRLGACRGFQNGTCNRGDRCKFVHITRADALRRHWQDGQLRFRSRSAREEWPVAFWDALEGPEPARAEEGQLCIAAGATGAKCVRPLWPDWDGALPRENIQQGGKKDNTAWLFAAETSWWTLSSKGVGQPASRAGLEAWRVATLHVDNQCAHKVDVSGQAAVDIWTLVLGNRIKIVGGDFNRATDVAHNCLKHLILTKPAFFGIRFRRFAGRGDEICLYVFNYPDELAHVVEVRRAKADEISDRAFAGLRALDSDSHYPLVLVLAPEPKTRDLNRTPRRSQIFGSGKHSEGGRKKRRQHKHAVRKRKCLSGDHDVSL